VVTDTSLPPDAIVLPSVLDLAAAQALKTTLCEHFLCRTQVVLNGRNVERVGTPVLQVLLAASRSVASDGGSFKLLQPSHALRSALCDLGLSGELARWETQ